jgi:hypothetical protein
LIDKQSNRVVLNFPVLSQAPSESLKTLVLSQCCHEHRAKIEIRSSLPCYFYGLADWLRLNDFCLPKPMYEAQFEPNEPSSAQAGAGSDSQHLSRSVNADPSPKTRPDAAATEQAEETAILQNYGVNRTVAQGLVQYRLPGTSEDRLLFETPDSALEYLQSSRKLEALTQANIAKLESTYHVAFSKNHEPVVRPLVVNPQHPNRYMDGPMLYAREPRLSELLGVEGALKSSQPSQLTDAKGHTLKYYYLEKPSAGQNTYDAGLFAGDSRGRASVMIEPDAYPFRPITAADAIANHQDLKSSIEALTAHEMAHNTESKLGLFDYRTMAPVAEKLGWTVAYDSDKNPQYWLLQGKNNDYYRLTTDGLSSNNGWIRCNADGQPLDNAGKIVENADLAPHYDNKAVRELARVRPPTDYFTEPTEELADGLMLYRLGDNGQSQLHASGDQVFNTVAQVDQSEIDLQFGKNSDGSSKMHRLPDGALADTNDAAAPNQLAPNPVQRIVSHY